MNKPFEVMMPLSRNEDGSPDFDTVASFENPEMAKNAVRMACIWDTEHGKVMWELREELKEGRKEIWEQNKPERQCHS
jgi:hypothetical protein